MDDAVYLYGICCGASGAAPFVRGGRMSIPYLQFQYLWPPRPKTTFPRGSQQWEDMKKRSRYIAQLKLNGQRNVIFISPDFEIDMWNRHQERHATWTCPDWLAAEVKSVVQPNGKWMVIDGELLDKKDKDKAAKNVLYWWDVLVLDSEYLLFKNYEWRYNALRARTSPPASSDGCIAKLTDHIWVAENIPPERYEEDWKRTEKSWVEGYVFKDLDGKLQPCIGENTNGSWMCRCRVVLE